MLLYLIYSIFISSLLNIINIKEIFYILNYVFTDNLFTFYIYVILLGILLKLFKSNTLKIKKEIIPLLLLDIIKIVFINYHIILCVISLLISLILIKNKISLNKYIRAFLYILLPFSSFYILSLKDKNSYLNITLVINITIYLLINLNKLHIIINIYNILSGIVLCLFSYSFYSNKRNKKRNIISIIFLIIFLLLYLLP